MCRRDAFLARTLIIPKRSSTFRNTEPITSLSHPYNTGINMNFYFFRTLLFKIKPIFAQSSISIPSENVRKPKVC